MDWTKAKYFEYGYPADLKNYYGLWSPALNLFVFVHHDLDLLFRLQWILSSKLLVIIVQFQDRVREQNQIDNSCCHNWTVEKISEQHFSTAFKDTSIHIFPVKQIINNSPTDQDVFHLKNYCFLCSRWYRLLERLYSSQLESMTDDVVEGKFSKFKKWAYQTFWLEKDISGIDDIDKKINDKYVALCGIDIFDKK